MHIRRRSYCSLLHSLAAISDHSADGFWLAWYTNIISRCLRLEYLSYYETKLKSLYSRIYGAVATAVCSTRLLLYPIIRMIDSGRHDIPTYSELNQSVPAAWILELLWNVSEDALFTLTCLSYCRLLHSLAAISDHTTDRNILRIQSVGTCD
jgi:hypothetical protein